VTSLGLAWLAPLQAMAQTITNSQPQLPGPPSTPTVSTPQTTQVYTLSSLELSLLRSLQANPATAPYQFATQRRGNKIALRARVGTKVIHDIAIQTALALNVPVIDEILIDTLAAHQVAAAGPGMGGFGVGPGGYGYGSGNGMAGPSSGMGFPGAGYPGSLPYTYPAPLFGRLDDPFFGFEPPAISYPAYWGALTYNRVGPPPAMNPNGNGQPVPVSNANPNGNFNPPNMAGNAPINLGDPQQTNLPDGTIEMSIDPRGVATLRGSVPSLAERITLGQKVAQTPGVTQVVNLLNVKPGMTAPPLSDRPPPPPVPALAPAANPPVAANGPELTPIVPETDAVGLRATKAVASKSGVTNSSIKVKVRDGVASLTGKVPTVYEAMMAFRAVQKTPGVREIEDRLEFVVPDGSSTNPLVEKGQPEDVEPYLMAQLRRQLGDLAHVDRVRVSGDSLELKGTLEREEDRPRFDAIIRSMPILRGFRISAEFNAEAR
jgi:hypothetical protein